MSKSKPIMTIGAELIMYGGRGGRGGGNNFQLEVTLPAPPTAVAIRVRGAGGRLATRAGQGK